MGIARTRAVLLIAAFLAGALGTSIYLEARGLPSIHTPTRTDPDTRSFMAIFDRSQPLMIPGERVIKEEASSRAGYEVVEPTWFPPSVERRGETWFSPATNESGLRYGVHLVINFREWPPARDPATTYAQQASDWNAGFTTTLGNRPAWIIPPNARAPGEPPVSVIHMTRGRIDITLYGQMSIDDLQKVAESLPE